MGGRGLHSHRLRVDSTGVDGGRDTDLLLSSVPEMELGWLEQVIAHRKMESAGN